MKNKNTGKQYNPSVRPYGRLWRYKNGSPHQTLDSQHFCGSIQDMKRGKKIYEYSVFYEAAPDGDGYAVFAPALPGCHSQGDTLEEAEGNIKEAIELYLESLATEQEPIPEETKVFHGRVSVTA